MYAMDINPAYCNMALSDGRLTGQTPGSIMVSPVYACSKKRQCQQVLASNQYGIVMLPAKPAFL